MKRLITDRDLADGLVRGPIVLDGNTLLTPSARDRAARLGIPVVEAGGASASAPGAGSGPSAYPRCAGTCAGTCGGACAGTCGGACAAAATGGGAGGAPVQAASLPAGLADGLYLVRVAAGRPVSVLPAAGPGLSVRSSVLPVPSPAALAAFAPARGVPAPRGP